MSLASVMTGRSVISSAHDYEEEAPELDWDEDIWPQLHPDHLLQIEKANVFKMGEARTVYNYLAKNYDGIYSRLNYVDHK